MNRKIMVFVDGNNFESAVNELYGSQQRIDLNRLAEYVAGVKCQGDLVQYYYYTGLGDKKREPEKYKKTLNFISTLNQKYDKCVAKVGRLQYLGIDINGKDIYTEKATDVQLAVDLVSAAYSDMFDEAVIVSADSDYEPAIKKVQELGKKVVVCIVDRQKAGYLKQLCNQRIILQQGELNVLKR